MHFPGYRGAVSGPGEGEPRQRGDALLPRLRQGAPGDNTIYQWSIQHTISHYHYPAVPRGPRHRVPCLAVLLAAGHAAAGRTAGEYWALIGPLAPILSCDWLLQALVLPRTTILLLLFLTAFIWIAVILMLLLAVRLRCIIWDLSRSFLLRLAITIFSIILIYTMAQVNVVGTHWTLDTREPAPPSVQFTCQREALASCEAKPSAKIQNHPGHRWCPLPHYILISCMLR